MSVAPTTDLLSAMPHPPGADGSKKQALEAYLASGNAYMAKGEFHLAIVDYGRSMHCVEVGSTPVCERNPEAYERRNDAVKSLYWFFKSEGNPDYVDPKMSDWSREAVRSAKLPRGYIVTADGDHVLATFPDSEQGQCDAIAFADYVARDEALRHRYDRHFLAESDEFDTVVFRHDGSRTMEVHRQSAHKAADEIVQEMEPVEI